MLHSALTGELKKTVTPQAQSCITGSMTRLAQFAPSLFFLLIVGCGTNTDSQSARTPAAVPANKVQTAQNGAPIPPNIYILPPKAYLLPKGEPLPPAEAPPDASHLAGAAQRELPSAQPTDNALKYWLTSSSGKRHNSRCRFYSTSRGVPCGPNDGTACLKCGG